MLIDAINNIDIIETLKFCLLCSIATIFSSFVLFYLIYRFASLFVEFKSLQERVNFLEECLSEDIKKNISSKFKSR